MLSRVIRGTPALFALVVIATGNIGQAQAPLKTAGEAKPITALYADPAQPDLSGLWVVAGAFSFSPDGKPPKLIGKYKDLYAKRMKANQEGRPIDDMTADCMPSGMPHLLVVPYPFEVMQTPGRVTLLYEYDGVVRRVLIGGQHADPKKVAPLFYGDSIGRWDGDTLVIETTNIRDDTQIDYTGIPHSEALTVTERLRRLDTMTIESQITLDDPKAFEEPFKATRNYKMKPKWKMAEYVCQQNNRNKRDESGRTTGGAVEK